MARFFCGPDRTPWISIDFTTPEATVRTMLEALRRDEPEALYRCLASDYARSLGIDDWTMQLGWSKIVAANPGLHVAGYAQVPPARRLSADTAEVMVEVEGHTMHVRLRRSSQWRLRYERPPLPPEQPGGPPRQPSPATVSQGLAAAGPHLVVQQAESDARQAISMGLQDSVESRTPTGVCTRTTRNEIRGAQRRCFFVRIW